MSTNVMGFVSPENEMYKKQCKVLMACIDAGIKELPAETAKYFGSKTPYEELIEEKLQINLKLNPWSCEYGSGYEIIVSEIPEGVDKIRFYNSW